LSHPLFCGFIWRSELGIFLIGTSLAPRDKNAALLRAHKLLHSLLELWVAVRPTMLFEALYSALCISLCLPYNYTQRGCAKSQLKEDAPNLTFLAHPL
jgi:hypothetical protein